MKSPHAAFATPSLLQWKNHQQQQILLSPRRCNINNNNNKITMIEESISTETPTETETTTNTSSSSPSTTKKTKPAYVPKPPSPFKSNASWSKDFHPGFGRKGPGSTPDWDLRPASLREEDSSGVCDSCKGTGFMTCTFCEGVPFKDDDGTEMKCPACNSEPLITCTACFGSKKQVELVGNWWERGVAALFGN